MEVGWPPATADDMAEAVHRAEAKSACAALAVRTARRPPPPPFPVLSAPVIPSLASFPLKGLKGCASLGLWSQLPSLLRAPFGLLVRVNAGSPRWTRSRRGTSIVLVPPCISAPIHGEPCWQPGSRKSYVLLDSPSCSHYWHRPHVAALGSVPSTGSDTAAATVRCTCVQVPRAYDPRGGDARLVSRRGVLPDRTTITNSPSACFLNA